MTFYYLYNEAEYEFKDFDFVNNDPEHLYLNGELIDKSDVTIRVIDFSDYDFISCEEIALHVDGIKDVIKLNVKATNIKNSNYIDTLEIVNEPMAFSIDFKDEFFVEISADCIDKLVDNINHEIEYEL